MRSISVKRSLLVVVVVVLVEEEEEDLRRLSVIAANSLAPSGTPCGIFHPCPSRPPLSPRRIR